MTKITFLAGLGKNDLIENKGRFQKPVKMKNNGAGFYFVYIN